MTDKTNEFINKAKKVHGDLYDYSKVNYIKAIQKVIIICKTHGEYLQQPSNHLQGNGCTECSILNRNNESRYTSEIFINKAQEVHGDKYDYSKVKYVDSKTKITIICKEHGEYLQAPNKHLQKQGCNKCGGHCKSNNEEFIMKAKQIHGDKYDYSKVNYVNNQTKVIITCKDHGDYLQVPNSHLQGCGCIKCIGANNKYTTNEFIQKANNIHGNKYDYSKVNYVNCQTKVIIICKEHGEFEQTPTNHLTSKYGCDKCSAFCRGDTKKNNCKNKFIDNAIKVHGNKYDYSKSIYTGCENKLVIVCKDHGEFEQQPNNHLYGKGCYECARIKINNDRRLSNEEFITKANQIHNNAYIYSNVDYKSYHEKVKIICKIHGEFEKSASGHLQGSGCFECGKIRTDNYKKYTNAEFIEKASIIHNKKYDYSKTNYINSKTKVIVTCKEHGDFDVRPNNHISSIQGCPKCLIKKQYSKAQIKWLNFIQSKDKIIIQHAENSNEYNIPNTNFKADGYCVETNTIYEYHGDYWHGNPNRFNSSDINNTTKCTFGELYQNTLNKEQIIRDMGFNLITIWESDWIKLNKCVKILQRKFKNYLLTS